MLFSLILLVTLSQAPVKEIIPGSTNVTRVEPSVFCAGATHATTFPALKKRGFAAVVNLRREQEPGADIPGARAAATAAGLKFIHIPVDGARPDSASADKFLQAVTDPANHPIFIHCGSANRVAAMWLIKRVVVDRWEIPRATREAEAIGLTSPGLKQFAIEYATSHR
jgi:uncharacterized protein (TIGR01244 family)